MNGKPPSIELGAASDESDRFRTLVENLPVGVYRSTPEGRIIEANAVLARMLGYESVDELHNLRVQDLYVHTSERSDHITRLSGVPVEFGEFEIRRRDGSTIWVRDYPRATYGDNGETLFFDGVITDISDRKAAELALAQAHVELERRVFERTTELARANQALQSEIAERERREEVLRLAQSQWSQFLEASPDPMWIKDASGRYVEVNDALLTLWDKNRNDLIGKTDGEVYPSMANAFSSTDQAALDDGTSETDFIERLGGHNLFFSVKKVRLCSPAGETIGTLGVARDVTERKRDEQARLLLATAVEQAAEGIMITDLGGTIEYVNPALIRITGFSADELLGQNHRIIQGGTHDQAFFSELFAFLQGGVPWNGRVTNRKKDGSFWESESTISPIRDASGATVKFVAVMRDVTQELILTEQLRESQKMQTIGKLAGGVAHDFNNLLQAMLGTIAALHAHAADPARMEQAVRELEVEVKSGAALTRQLLLFSRREVVKPERLDLNEVVRTTRPLLLRPLREHHRLIFQLADTPLFVDADRGQLQQVLVNLAINAADAMPEGGELCVRTSGGGEEVLLEVEDKGIGMSEEVQARVFEPFFTTKGEEKGVGLGLSVVHGIVAEHGGRIVLQSQVGKGTAVRIVLPLRGSGVFPKVHRASLGRAEAPRGRGERILVVEDDHGARAGLYEVLSLLGYQVTVASSGEEAMSHADGPAFDLLLIDMLLPGVSGVELARELRSYWSGIKVILMSGYTEDEAVRHGVKTGETLFLQKPFDLETLAHEVRLALKS